MCNRLPLDAHYTSPTVVRAMYAALAKLGFQTGRVLEPSVGVGNFLGLMPASLRQQTQVTGVELDSLTSRLAAALNPSSSDGSAPFVAVFISSPSVCLAHQSAQFHAHLCLS
ncbi:MAG: hypothetical protein LBO00_07185, partial [Zoogloeaceae bacterium]|nr:hypothetical protein [Zoogloeaceae bacterium]